MKRALPLLVIALAACGPERGAGVYPESQAERDAAREAAFAKGEALGLDGLRAKLVELGVEPAEIATVPDPDYAIDRLVMNISVDRLDEFDTNVLAGLVVDSNFRLTFADPAIERAVDVGEELYRREMAAEIAILKRHGDWDRVPRQNEGEAMAEFGRRLEHWCDFEPGAALRVIDGRWLEYTRGPVDAAVGEAKPGPDTARFLCLRRAVYATQLRRHFIGYRGEAPPPLY